jgi:hypothetical protein
MKKNNAEKLIKDIKSKIDKWNERSNFTIKGVKNLSMSDLDTLELYARTFAVNGSFTGLMDPRGPIKQVLDKYEIAI